MDDFSAIVNYVSKSIELTEEEITYYKTFLRTKHLKKKQFIVQPDFVCTHVSFILSGSMCAYLIDNKGQKHVVAFGIEDWWIADFNSYLYQQPATLFVEALEDTTLIQISYENEQRLMEEIPKFEKFYRIMAQGGYANLQRRILADISLDAAERYEYFLTRYPKVASRVPQYALASYLGISQERLSKIRNRRVKS